MYLVLIILTSFYMTIIRLVIFVIFCRQCKISIYLDNSLQEIKMKLNEMEPAPGLTLKPEPKQCEHDIALNFNSY